jgi:SAM-dependent methyltransferase
MSGEFFRNVLYARRDKYFYLNYGSHILEKYLKMSRYEKVLDIGCEKGRDLLIAKRLAIDSVTLWGIEINKEKTLLLEKEGIKPVILDLEKERLPFADNSIDLVIVNQIYEHLKEIFWVSHEISRVLKIGGRIILGVPNLASFHNRLLLLLGNQPTCIAVNSAHVRGYTKKGLLDFFGIGHFELVSYAGSNFYPFAPPLSMMLAKLFPSAAVSIFFLLEKQKEYKDEYVEFLKNEHLQTNFRFKQ